MNRDIEILEVVIPRKMREQLKRATKRDTWSNILSESQNSINSTTEVTKDFQLGNGSLLEVTPTIWLIAQTEVESKPRLEWEYQSTKDRVLEEMLNHLSNKKSKK